MRSESMELVDHPGRLIVRLPPGHTINLDNSTIHCNMNDLAGFVTGAFQNSRD